MQPRLKTSTQWSPFPEELCLLTAEVLSERFKDEYDLENAQFVVEGQIYAHEIVGRYGLRFEGQLKQMNFELSIEYDSEKEKALDCIQRSMDVVDHLWEELLEDDLDDSELLPTWESLTFEKKTYFFRYSTVNTQLEEEADRLLAQFEKKLVYEAEEQEDVLQTNDHSNSDNLH